MLTKVYLDGIMGSKFGDEWEFEINSPREALQMIDANSPGFLGWIKTNSGKYSQYQVVVEYENGNTEELSDDTFLVNRKMKSIRFVPIISGAGKWWGVVVGVIVMIIGIIMIVFEIPYGFEVFRQGAIMTAAALITAIATPDPKKPKIETRTDSKSLFSSGFGGVEHTSEQGVPVPVIYGRYLVKGARPISAGVVIE